MYPTFYFWSLCVLMLSGSQPWLHGWWWEEEGPHWSAKVSLVLRLYLPSAAMFFTTKSWLGPSLLQTYSICKKLGRFLPGQSCNASLSSPNGFASAPLLQRRGHTWGTELKWLIWKITALFSWTGNKIIQPLPSPLFSWALALNPCGYFFSCIYQFIVDWLVFLCLWIGDTIWEM